MFKTQKGAKEASGQLSGVGEKKLLEIKQANHQDSVRGLAGIDRGPAHVRQGLGQAWLSPHSIVKGPYQPASSMEVQPALHVQGDFLSSPCPMPQVLVVYLPFIRSLPHSFLSTHVLPYTMVLVLRGWQGARGTGLPSGSVIQWLRWKIWEYAVQG